MASVVQEQQQRNDKANDKKRIHFSHVGHGHSQAREKDKGEWCSEANAEQLIGGRKASN